MGGRGGLNHQHIEQYHPPHQLLPKDLKTGLTKKGGYEGYNLEKVKGNGFILFYTTIHYYYILHYI